MWEGQATTRKLQVIAGFTLGIISLPFLYLGVAGILLFFIKQSQSTTALILSFISLVVACFCILLSYRLIKARGVKKGGGIASPIVFKILGFLFLFLGAVMTYKTANNFNFKAFIGIIPFLFLSFISFVAARHRGSMRDIE